jgi:hypothetical protein
VDWSGIGRGGIRRVQRSLLWHRLHVRFGRWTGAMIQDEKTSHCLIRSLPSFTPADAKSRQGSDERTTRDDLEKLAKHIHNYMQINDSNPTTKSSQEIETSKTGNKETRRERRKENSPPASESRRHTFEKEVRQHYYLRSRVGSGRVPLTWLRLPVNSNSSSSSSSSNWIFNSSLSRTDA